MKDPLIRSNRHVERSSLALTDIIPVAGRIMFGYNTDLFQMSVVEMMVPGITMLRLTTDAQSFLTSGVSGIPGTQPAYENVVTVLERLVHRIIHRGFVLYDDGERSPLYPRTSEHPMPINAKHSSSILCLSPTVVGCFKYLQFHLGGEIYVRLGNSHSIVPHGDMVLPTQSYAGMREYEVFPTVDFHCLTQKKSGIGYKRTTVSMPFSSNILAEIRTTLSCFEDHIHRMRSLKDVHIRPCRNIPPSLRGEIARAMHQLSPSAVRIPLVVTTKERFNVIV